MKKKTYQQPIVDIYTAINKLDILFGLSNLTGFGEGIGTIGYVEDDEDDIAPTVNSFNVWETDEEDD
jgi:hypothetical protein